MKRFLSLVLVGLSFACTAEVGEWSQPEGSEDQDLAASAQRPLVERTLTAKKSAPYDVRSNAPLWHSVVECKSQNYEKIVGPVRRGSDYVYPVRAPYNTGCVYKMGGGGNWRKCTASGCVAIP